MDDKKTKHFYVAGKVQGVWYRASTHRKAVKLALTGWVRNLEDGRVEVLATGDVTQLKNLEEWLWKGPVGANVESIDINDIELEDHKTFEVKH